MAIAFVQEAGATTTGSTSTTLATTWGSATAAGNLLIMGVCCGSNSLSVTFTPPGGWTLLSSQLTANGGANPAVTGALYYKKNAASESGSKTFTFSTAVWASMFLAEFSGCDTAAPLDQEASATSGGSTNCTTGTTSTTAVANELLVALTACNSNFTQTTPQNSFTLQDTQKSAASGTARVSGGFLYRIVSATGTYGTGVTLSSSNPNIGKVASFKIASTGATVNLTSTGTTAGPQQFPLGPPDMTGATTLTDTTPDAVWAPTLTDNVDYILNCPAIRSRQLKIVGGRNVYVPKLFIHYQTVKDAEMVYFANGNVDRIVHIDTCHLDPNGLQCDAFKTHGSFTNRNLQIRLCRIERLYGQQDQVHADCIQASAGLGDFWVEDATVSSDFFGFQTQREATVDSNNTAWNITNAVRTSNSVVYTANSHGLAVGDLACVANINPSGYNGGHLVTAATTNTFTCLLGDLTPASYTSGGIVQKGAFTYDIGSCHYNRVNVVGVQNTHSGGNPPETIGAFHLGARSAPTPDPGDANKTGYQRQNDDATRVTTDFWSGQYEFVGGSVYISPYSKSAELFVAPDGGSSTWSVVKPTLNTAPTPDQVEFNSHPQVSGVLKVGAPPLGDYVTYPGGMTLTATAPASGGTGAGVTVKTVTGSAALSAITAGAYPNAYDLFTRSVGAGGLGTANLGGTYTLSGTAADFSVNGSAAVIAVTAAGQSKRATLSSVSMVNQYATGTFAVDTQPAVAYTAFDVFLRYVDANNYYRCRCLLFSGGVIQLRWDMNLAGSITTIKAAVTSGLTLNLNNDYGIYASAVGSSPTTLSAWVWDATAAPPPLPVPVLVSVTDSSSALQVASAAGIGAALNTGSTATATKVSVAQWDVWPTRMQSADCAARVTVADARQGTQTFANTTKRRWTPRTG